jgi:hypothetical protein
VLVGTLAGEDFVADDDEADVGAGGGHPVMLPVLRLRLPAGHLPTVNIRG